MVVPKEWVDSIRTTLPELPDARAARYRNAGLSDFEIEVLISDPAICRYFDAVVAQNAAAKDAAKWIVGDLNSLLKDQKLGFDASPVSAAHLAELIGLIQAGTISGKMAKEVLVQVGATGKSPKEIVAASGATQISDTGALEAIVNQILDKNPDVVEKVKNGKTNSADFLMGQVMRETKGRANPDMVRGMILEQISKR
ncbi:hypothetical protein EBR96_07735 [bacterium]|nr:hypothetical protein [bacterium]